MLRSMDGYAEAFGARGGRYDEAMRRHPRARDQEFGQLVSRAGLTPGMALGDVPAGGGYLGAHLPAGVAWLGHEPCASFQQGGALHGVAPGGPPLLPFPWADASLDRVVSLAGVHHQPDKRPFHREARRVLRAGGLYLLSDVAEDSPTARFLDGFVGRHNSTGHEGFYLGKGCVAELEDAGFRVLSDERVRFHWLFSSCEELAAFCTLLFDLRAPGPSLVADAAREMLGIDEMPGGEVGLRWALRTLVCAPAGTSGGASA